MIQKGYELDAAQVELAVAWLKNNEPAKAIGFDDVKAKVAEARDKPLPKNGEVGNGRSSDNVKATKGGNATDYTLRRLARDCPEMLDRIESGELAPASSTALLLKATSYRIA